MKLPLRQIFTSFSTILIFVLNVFNHAYAIDYKPWYGRVYEIDTAVDIRFQLFDRVDSHQSSHHDLLHVSNKRKELDTFIALNAGTALDQDRAVELEVIGLQSRKQSFGMDAVRLSGRYRFLNDIVGDPVSLSTGLTVSTIFPNARKNIATFDHGGVALEGHLSVGREMSSGPLWTSRAYGVFAVGIADVGSPWLRANASLEHNFCDRHRLELFAESIWGLGGNHLNLYRFRGYGSVNYQAVDLCSKYVFQADYGVLFSLGGGYRLYARNCPKNACFILLRLDYPLNL